MLHQWVTALFPTSSAGLASACPVLASRLFAKEKRRTSQPAAGYSTATNREIVVVHPAAPCKSALSRMQWADNAGAVSSRVTGGGTQRPKRRTKD